WVVRKRAAETGLVPAAIPAATSEQKTPGKPVPVMWLAGGAAAIVVVIALIFVATRIFSSGKSTVTTPAAHGNVGPPGLQVVAAWGTQGTAAGQYKDPRGVALNGSGDVFVADTNNN